MNDHIQYTITNKNGIVGFILIKQIGQEKKAAFVSFENDYSDDVNHLDIALIMQKIKNYSFTTEIPDEEILESVLNQSIDGYSRIKNSMGFKYFIDDLAEKLAELKRLISEM
jgi:hypothetical protein